MTVLEALRAQITAANKAYWEDGKEIISDIEYDRLIRNLKKLSPNDPLLSHMGSEKMGDNKVAHIKRMYSLDKAYSYEEVLKWASSVARSPKEVFAVSPKYDGLSVEMQGDRLVTRGKDGIAGNDITHIEHHTGAVFSFHYDDSKKTLTDNGFMMDQILEHAEDDHWSDIGELMIHKDVFRKLKETYPEVFGEYKNTRNTVSAFANGSPDSIMLALRNERGGPVYIGTWVYHRAYEIDLTLEELLHPTRNLVEELRDFCGYPTDGIVFRLKDDEYAESLGYTEHHPRGAIALKFTDEQNESVVQSIDWQVGERHITPVCNIKPIPLEDATVKRATLHCHAFVLENKVGVGSNVVIERRGDVIPKVVSVTNDTDIQPDIPKVCPCCGKPLVIEGKFLSCTNDLCIDRIVCKIDAGLKILDVKGIGPNLVRKVVEDLGVQDIMQWCAKMLRPGTFEAPGLIYTDYQKQLLTSTIRKLADNGVASSTLLKSVRIEEVGNMFANAVNKYAGGIDSLLKIPAVDDMYTYLVDHPGINLDALTNFMVWMELHKEDFVQYRELFPHIPEKTDYDGVGGAEGVVCFTGTGPKPRKELAELAKKFGFVTTDNVNLCSLLVCEDTNKLSSKLKKAKAKGILIRTYDEFLKSLG